MAKVSDLGHVVAPTHPVRLPVYGPHATDPAHVGTGAVYYVNDKQDGIPRGRLAVSNGATEDLVAYVNDLEVIEGKIRRIEAIATAAAHAPKASIEAVSVPSHEVEALHRRLAPIEQAIGELKGGVHTLQGGLRRLEVASHNTAAPSASVPAGPSAVDTPATPDVLAALLPIERRLSEVEIALELDVLAEIAVRAASGDAAAATLIAEDAALLGLSPQDHMAGIAQQRNARHLAIMQARLQRLKG